MNYKIIADAGSTKIDWVLTDAQGGELKRLHTPGVNALLADKEDLDACFCEVRSNIEENVKIVSIYYYGAGCATPEICNKVQKSLQGVFGAENIEVYSDLLGAARSLFGDKKGIACILGTGSNSCLYDGKRIVRNIPSLGFILGDEGSGAALGKRLVSDSFKGHLPAVISEKFLETYGLSLGSILDKVYKTPAPNKFLASLVPFIREHLWNPYVYSMVRKEFENFLQRNVSPYQGSRTLPISFTGGIARHFDVILRDAVAQGGYKLGEITEHPIEGLIKYHSQN